MNETSTIEWVNISDRKPSEKHGWYMVVMMPVNHSDFKDNSTAMNDWISNFGLNKLWWNNGEFWQDHRRVTDRITYWAELPSVPLFK